MAKRHSTGRKRTAATDRQLDKIYDDFLKQPAQITDEQCAEMEKLVSNTRSPNAIARRVALASLARSGAQLVKGIEENDAAVAIAHGLVAVEHYIKSLKDLTGLMETAVTRMAMSLCNREDMWQLIEFARAEQSLGTESWHHSELRQ